MDRRKQSEDVKAPARILLVSATWPQRALLKAQLEETGFEVIGTATPEEALDWLTDGPAFDLVILDTQHLPPDPRLLRQLGDRGLPTIVLTGPFDRARWERVLPGVNVRATLVRPVFIREVVRAVRDVLG